MFNVLMQESEPCVRCQTQMAKNNQISNKERKKTMSFVVSHDFHLANALLLFAIFRKGLTLHYQTNHNNKKNKNASRRLIVGLTLNRHFV